jgi:predicted negative regulator of RcsB-dependent stress response
VSPSICFVAPPARHTDVPSEFFARRAKESALPSSAQKLSETALSIYETDEEKVEALKKWWKDNGTSVVAGVVIGLGAVFGWRAWVQHQDAVGQQASAAFEQLMASVESANTDSARAQATLLNEEFEGTPYTSLASLLRARIEIDSGDQAAAQAALKQAIETAPDPAVARIAALRLIRILIAEGALEDAAAAIEQHDEGGAFGAEFDALRGDVAAASGRLEDAREAYSRAIAAGAANGELLRLKLDNLPPTG